VKVVYNGAIKLPEKSILATGIFGDWALSTAWMPG
jgi:hypothetical protein